MPQHLRLRVLVPRGAVAGWLGDVLLGLDALGSVELQLERVDPAPGAPRATANANGWERRQRALRPWAPDPPAQARLACWEAAAARARAADISLSFDAQLHRPAGAATTPACGRVWAVCDGDGEPLARRFPLLRSITAGEGIRLHCLQREPATGTWQLRRTLHVPARSRYRAGLAGAVASMQRLVQLAMADLQIENERAVGRVDTARVAFAFQPRAAAKEEGLVRSAWRGLRGRWHEWYGRQRRRWVSEYWRIGVIDAPIGRLTDPAFRPDVRWITNESSGGYWADPFGLPGNSSRLACEFFDERTGDVTAARMAGNPFWHDGMLYRPAQDCLRTYGAAVVLNQVVTLTPTEFNEVQVRRLAPQPGGPCPDGLHTLTAWGDRTLIDGKRHGMNLVTLRRKFRRAQRLLGGTSAAPVASGRPRVFVYVPHLRMGGGETSMLRLAHGLAETGLAVDLVVHTLDTSELPLPSGVNVLSLDCGSSAAAVFKLAAALRRHRPRWVLSAFPHTNIAAIGARALSRTDTCCIVTEHAPLSHQIAQQGGWRYRLLPPLLRWSYRRADAVVAVSNGVRDDLQAMVGLASPPVVIRNPVLPPDFDAELAQLPDHPWLLDPELEVVLSVCRLGVEKDLPTLLHAFAEVRRTRPAARLLMAGEGSERPMLAALIESLGLGAVAQLPGRTDQPLRWMQHAAVFVLASRFEGFGNVLVEAMACGTPVVSTDCPVGPREVLEGGRWGALVPVGDAPAMAREIHRVLETGTLPAGAREAALQHTEARACAAYRRLFDSLLPSPATPC